MKLFAVLSTLTVLVAVGGAQAPQTAKPATAKPAPPPTLNSPPVGNMAQVMRGILFPNSNILFDVQSNDPATFGKKTEGGGASSTFSGIYTGWQIVENAAITLDEAARLLMVPGRKCENGRDVPVKNADWVKYTTELRAASQKMLAAAKAKNKELASDTTNDVAGACENCHIVYRDKSGGGPRCIP
jgi:hypothetical protein